MKYCLNIRQAYQQADRPVQTLDFQSLSTFWPFDTEDKETLGLLDLCVADARQTSSRPERIKLKGVSFSSKTDIADIRMMLCDMMAVRAFRASFLNRFSTIIPVLFADLAQRNALDDLKAFTRTALPVPMAPVLNA